MQIPSSNSRRQDRGDEAMTSMIDVVFLLLIFFICAAAGQVKESVLATDLSETGSVDAAAAVEQDPWIVEVWIKLRTNADGQSTVDMNGTDYAPFEQVFEPLKTLAEAAPENPVILDIDGDVPMRDVVSVYDVCIAAGFESVNFAARAEDVRGE